MLVNVNYLVYLCSAQRRLEEVFNPLFINKCGDVRLPVRRHHKDVWSNYEVLLVDSRRHLQFIVKIEDFLEGLNARLKWHINVQTNYCDWGDREEFGC